MSDFKTQKTIESAHKPELQFDLNEILKPKPKTPPPIRRKAANNTTNLLLSIIAASCLGMFLIVAYVFYGMMGFANAWSNASSQSSKASYEKSRVVKDNASGQIIAKPSTNQNRGQISILSGTWFIDIDDSFRGNPIFRLRLKVQNTSNSIATESKIIARRVRTGRPLADSIATSKIVAKGGLNPGETAEVFVTFSAGDLDSTKSSGIADNEELQVSVDQKNWMTLAIDERRKHGDMGDAMDAIHAGAIAASGQGELDAKTKAGVEGYLDSLRARGIDAPKTIPDAARPDKLDAAQALRQHFIDNPELARAHEKELNREFQEFLKEGRDDSEQQEEDDRPAMMFKEGK